MAGDTDGIDEPQQHILQQLPDGWQQVLDPNTGSHYYCNVALGITQWHRPTPPASTSATEPEQPAQPSTSAPADQSSSGGWFYTDAFGARQGPFTQEQLKQWRAFLPMNLEVSYVPVPSSSGSKADAEAEAEAEDELSTELAELLGDGKLLASWQKHPASKTAPMAPPAPVWDHWVQSRTAMAAAVAAATAAPAPTAGTSSSAAASSSAPSARPESFNSYADAVIAGLSPHDEAVQLAHLAAASGKTLQELLDFNYAAAASSSGTGSTAPHDDHDPAADGAAGDHQEGPSELPAVEGEQPLQHSKYDPSTGEYSFSADYCPRQRRLVLKDKEPQGPGALYGELSRWVDPAELERSLQEAAKRRNRPIPPAVLKKLKERKAATKAMMKKKNSWLLS